MQITNPFEPSSNSKVRIRQPNYLLFGSCLITSVYRAWILSSPCICSIISCLLGFAGSLAITLWIKTGKHLHLTLRLCDKINVAVICTCKNRIVSYTYGKELRWERPKTRTRTVSNDAAIVSELRSLCVIQKNAWNIATMSSNGIVPFRFKWDHSCIKDRIDGNCGKL